MPPEQKHVGRFIKKTNDPPRGNNYLFAIAIDKYEHAPSLSNCVRDAKGFIQILTSKYDFEHEKDGRQLIFPLFNEQATRKNILRKLGELKRQITPSDNFILYYSGHGEIEGDTGFWVPFEAHPEEDDEFVSTYDITHRLNAINSFHTFMLVDACFAGSLFSTHKSVKKGYESNPSRWGLAASHSREVALDGRPGENSPFADRLLKILRDNNTDFGVQKLCADLIEEVERVTNGKQTPVFQPLNVKGHELGQYVFHLKKDETADWKTAFDKDTVAAFEAYLATYPTGEYRGEAKKNIRHLEAAGLWSSIETAPDVNLWDIAKKTRLIDEFIEKYRGEQQYRQVLQEGKKLGWKKKFLNARGNKYALLEFVEENPPFFKEEAEKILRDWKQKEEAEAARKKAKQERLQKEEEPKKQEIPPLTPQPPKGGAATQGADSIQPSSKDSTSGGRISPFRGSGGVRGELSSFQKYGGAVLLAIVVMVVIVIINMLPEETDVPEIMRFQDDDGKYGFEKKDGFFIEPQFDDAGDFENGKAWVKRAREEFFINEEGQCVEGCPPLYRYRQKGRYGVKNADGKPVTPPHYDDVGFYGGGFIAVLKNDKWGYVNEQGEEAIPLEFDEVDYAEGFDNGQSWVRIGEEEFSIDKEGNKLLLDEDAERKVAIQEYDRLIEEAEAAYTNGEYQKARELFEKAGGMEVPDKSRAEEGILKCFQKLQ